MVIAVDLLRSTEIMQQLLAKLTASKLKTLAQACGSRLAGRKSEIASTLLASVAALDATSQRPIRVLSLDPGIVNLGVTRMYVPAVSSGLRPVVEQCYRDSIAVDAQSSSSLEFAEAAVEFLNRALLRPAGGSGADGESPVDVVLIEQQRPRSGGSASVPPGVLRANVLEGMLLASLRAAHPHITPVSVSPKAVVNFWEEKQQQTKRTYAMSKAVRRDLVAHWLETGTEVRFDAGTDWRGQKKRDDVFDSLVQAATWARWRRNAHRFEELVRALADGSPPRPPSEY